MRLLLDTHALVWLLTNPDLLPEELVRTAPRRDNQVIVSAVSAYEVALKFRLGRWAEVEPLALAFEEVCEASGFEVLDVKARHARVAGALSVDHRDPFDRLLAAQAMVEAMPIVSIDGKLDLFPVRRLWA